MPKIRVNVLGGRPLLDIASFARRGPGRHDRLTSGEVATIARTVNRVPEVVVKVLTKGSSDPRSVVKHFGYIGRYGELALETDEGEQLQGRGIGSQLLQDWDLDLDAHRRTAELVPSDGRQAPRLVHKLMLSMPAGTPPNAVLAAARNFLREEFALKHRYAFVLHTDEPHPHIHVVVKAVSEQGERLHIKKATLRKWRHEFARHLRDQGIEANATERAVRGENRVQKSDGIYRAAHRGASTHTRERLEAVAIELAKGGLRIEPGKEELMRTREQVERGWRAVSDILLGDGQPKLAADVRRFIGRMTPPRTEKELLAHQLSGHARGPRGRDAPSTR